MSDLIRKRIKRLGNYGDPVRSEELKRKFLPRVGSEYVSVFCKRLDLPYHKIQAWLNGDNNLPDYLQDLVSAKLETLR